MHNRALFGGVFLAYAIAEPLTTPVPDPFSNDIPPGHPWAAAIENHRELKLKARYLPYLDACYGKNSICAEYSDLDDECPIPPSVDDYDSWYECLCGTGWLATYQACNWCRAAFGDESLGDVSYWVGLCNTNDLSIAPIPSSILSIESRFNATNTLIATSIDSSGKSNGGAKTTPKTGQTSSTSSRRSITKHTSTSTLWGGDGGGPITNAPIEHSTVGISGPSTVTVAPAGGGGALVGPNLYWGTILSGLVVLLTMIGAAIFQI